MHTQEEFNRFALRLSLRDNLQGFQIPYIEDLIDIEPCTLWGKFLLKEREKYAFSGPQARAYMRQQPGALSSKRNMQPLLAQAASRRQHSKRHPSGQCLVAPLGRGGLRWRHVVFNSLVGAEQSHTQKTAAGGYMAVEQQVSAAAEETGDECSPPPSQLH